MKRWPIFSLVVAFVSIQASAVTIYVPQDYPTIQAALNAAVNGDSVLVAPGNYEGFYVNNGPDNITILGAGAFTSNPTTLYLGPTAPLGGCVWITNVSGWEMGQFVLRQVDPGGGSTFDFHYSDNCWIHHLDIAEVGAGDGNGMVIDGNTNCTIERCLVRAGNYDVFTFWYNTNTNVIVRNMTISGNGAGIITRSSLSNCHIYNNLVFNNDGNGIYMLYWQPTNIIEYNDSWGNDGANYSGFTPSPTNISQDPLVVGGPTWMAYTLQPNSPCINAGDPNSPLDPDGTIADIGCFYYNQIPPAGLTLDLEPVNPPIVIPIGGGTFQYTATIYADPTVYAAFEAWADLLLPNSYVMGPLFVRDHGFVAAEDTLYVTMNMEVSAWAMPGIYEFRGYLGIAPDSAWASDTFTFEKLANDGAAPPGEGYVSISGWEVNERINLPSPGQATLAELTLSSTPNPFNPTTAIRFELRVASHVSLKVYDTAGRLVGTLVNRDMPAGAHTATFDGSQLASGIYLAVLEVGGDRIVDRLLLVK